MHNSNTELSMYCSADSAPTLSNANTPIAVQTIGDSTFFTCNSGYVSSGLPIAPFYTCNAYEAFQGLYSLVNNTCNCTSNCILKLKFFSNLSNDNLRNDLTKINTYIIKGVSKIAKF